MVATVNAANGNDVRYGITFEARPVPRTMLERVVGEQGRKNGLPVRSTACDGDLAPQVGRSQRCTPSAAGQPVPVAVTVTSVDGGRLDVRIADA